MFLPDRICLSNLIIFCVGGQGLNYLIRNKSSLIIFKFDWSWGKLCNKIIKFLSAWTIGLPVILLLFSHRVIIGQTCLLSKSINRHLKRNMGIFVIIEHSKQSQCLIDICHSLSRVVVPATLHNISVNVHFTNFCKI